MDRGYEPHVDTGARDRAVAACPYDPHMKWFGLAFLLIVCVVVPLAVLSDTPERRAVHEQRKTDAQRGAAARLRAQAVSMLPPDATEVTVTREEFPTGWLTFVRVEGGKSIKFLVCYQRRDGDGDLSLSIARAD